MSNVQWTERFCVNVPELDNHHKKLFSMLNTLYELQKDRADALTVEGALDAFTEYLSYHFSLEEQALELVDYSRLEAHRKAHVSLLQQAKVFSEAVSESRKAFSVDYLDGLRNGLIDHIVTNDLLYSSCLTVKVPI